MYRRTIPKNKRKRRLQNYTERLCIPLSHRRDVLKSFHDRLGHSGTKCLFLTLSQQVYWKNLHADVCDYVATCDICLRAKQNFGFRATPLHPVTVPSEPGEMWSLDHKVLTRKTKSGNVAILCCVDQFTSWLIFRAVQDLTAETTARVFFQDIIATWGIPKLILSDKRPSFMGGLFTELAKLLHINHRTSAAMMSRTNGLTERTIEKLNSLIRLYADSDSTINQILPLAELSLRATAHSRTKISLFECVFGRKMRISFPGEPPKTSKLPSNQLNYYNWVKTHLKELHDKIK